LKERSTTTTGEEEEENRCMEKVWYDIKL
jgi:hypothetical protein